MAHKTTGIPFPQFWRLESKIMAPADLCLVKDLLPHRWCLLTVYSHGGRGKIAVWSLFLKDTDPFSLGFTLMILASSKGLTSQSSSWGLGLQHMNLERTRILRLLQCQCFLSCNLLFLLSPSLYISLGSNFFPSFKGPFKYSASTPILHYNLRNFMSNILLHAHLFWNFLSSYHLVVSIFSFLLRDHLYRVNEKNLSCTMQ